MIAQDHSRAASAHGDHQCFAQHLHSWLADSGCGHSAANSSGAPRSIIRADGQHHKTGGLAYQVFGAVRLVHGCGDACKIRRYIHFSASDVETLSRGYGFNYRVVHWVRDPIALVVSAYFYHKHTKEEKWLTSPTGVPSHLQSILRGTATFRVGRQQQVSLPQHVARDELLGHGETHQNFLLRVSLRTGLIAETVRALHEEIKEMRNAHLSLNGSSSLVAARVSPCRALTVCLDTFLTDSVGNTAERDAAFRSAFAGIFSFLLLNQSTVSPALTVAHDPHRKPARFVRHSAGGASITQAQRAEAASLVESLDRQLFGGALREDAALYRCALPPNSCL